MQRNLYRLYLINYWRNIDKNILLSVLLLFILGLFFSFSSTSSLAGERLNKDYYFFFSKHLIFTIFSLGIMFAISAIDTSLLKKIIIPLFLLSLIFLFLVPFVGVEVKGAKRWLNLYFFRLQPIELLKPFFILATVKVLTADKIKNNNLKYLLSFLLLSFVIMLLINQPDLGQAILLIGCWLAIVFISGINLFFIFGFITIFLTSISSLLFFMPEKFGYITKRLLSFFDPGKGDQFQSTSALDAIKLGGLKGRGMGEGVLKDSVPEAHTDYIISIISEEYGSILSSMIIFIFLYIAFRIIKNCINQEDQLIKFSLCGLASLLIFQTFIHLGVNTNLIPTTGMTLPFLSYGGSSLIGSAILAGVTLNYTKNRTYLYE